MYGIIFVGLLYASTGTVTTELLQPTTFQIFMESIKDFDIDEQFVEIEKELAKNPDEKTGQSLLNMKVNIIEEKKRIRTGSNKVKTIIYPKYKEAE